MWVLGQKLLKGFWDPQRGEGFIVKGKGLFIKGFRIGMFDAKMVKVSFFKGFLAMAKVSFAGFLLYFRRSACPSPPPLCPPVAGCCCGAAAIMNLHSHPFPKTKVGAVHPNHRAAVTHLLQRHALCSTAVCRITLDGNNPPPVATKCHF